MTKPKFVRNRNSMATLTETAYYSRKAVRWGIIGLVTLIILRIAIGMGIDIIRRSLPPPKLKPNYLFGKLPPPAFTQGASPSAEIKFTLQTVTGTIPIASDAAKVYFMPKNRVNLLSLSKAQTFVNKFGFTTSPRQISDTSYRWIDLKNPLRNIEMDIVSNQFTLTYAFVHDLTLFSEKNIPTPTEAVRETYSFLSGLGFNTWDINQNLSKVTYLKLVGDQLTPTTSQSQADAVRVDFFRSSYDNMPMKTDTATQANISFILSGARNSEKRILYVKFAYWAIDSQAVGIYKLKTADAAWQELVTGKAHIASLPTENQQNIPITSAYLGYFDGTASQLYVQPIYVFESDKGFTAYVPAIDPQWIESP